MEKLYDGVGETDALEDRFLEITDYLDDYITKNSLFDDNKTELEKKYGMGKGDIAYKGFDHRFADGVSIGYIDQDTLAIGIERYRRLTVFILDNQLKKDRFRVRIYDVSYDTSQSREYGIKKHVHLRQIHTPNDEELDWLEAVLAIEHFE